MLRALGRRLKSEEGEDDVRHLQRVRRWNGACAAVGLATMALPLNPISVVALSTWTYASWTMLAHHTCHGGYNRQPARPGMRMNSRRYALGSPLKRARDWLDWMLPEAWNLEHNNLHHYQLGEVGDPDLDVSEALPMSKGALVEFAAADAPLGSPALQVRRGGDRCFRQFPFIFQQNSLLRKYTLHPKTNTTSALLHTSTALAKGLQPLRVLDLSG